MTDGALLITGGVGGITQSLSGEGRVTWLINCDRCREALLAAVTGEGPPLAASVPRARDVARLLGGGGGSPIQPRVSLKSPPCQRAPSSEAPPPGSRQLCFLCGPALLSISSKETLSPPLLSGAPSAPPPARPSWSAQQEVGRAVGGSVCLLSAPGMGAPGG